MDKLQLEQTFFNWLDAILKHNPFPQNTMAINFNLYENEKSFFVQLISSSMYDENNDDWACEETFSTGENCFEIKRCKEVEDSELALELVMEMVYDFLNTSNNANILKQFVAICAGFVDDELECIWNSEDEED